jgi:DNA-directed RNA polymerase
LVEGFGYAAGAEGRRIVNRYVTPLAAFIAEQWAERPSPRKRTRQSLTMELWDDLEGASDEALAVTILSGALNSIWTRKPNDESAAVHGKIAIGREIWREARGAYIRQTNSEVAAQISKAVLRKGTMQAREQLERKILHGHGIADFPVWPDERLHLAGAWGLDCLVHGPLAEIFLLHDGLLCIDEGVIDHVAALVEVAMLAQPIYIPALESPLPWINFRNADETPFVRSARNEPAIQEAMVAGIAHVNAVNSLQSVGFTINKRILDFVRRAAKDPEGRKLLRKVKHKGGWETFRIDMAAASALVGSPFWVPLNIDWRGRVNPLPHLNFGRADHIRALFLFEHGEPITSEGINWLKKAAARAYGERTPFHERLKWANQNLENILAVANDPMSKLDWLQKAKHPFQFTAICMELQQALTEGPGFITHLPIELDAACSGAMHYSLLGLNADGARLTNLVATELDKVGCLYVATLQRIKKQVATTGHIIKMALTSGEGLKGGYDPDDYFAWWWNQGDRLNRDLLKSTVMPHLYGAKTSGLIKAVYEQLFERGYIRRQREGDNRELIPEGAVKYLVRIVEELLATEAIGAPAIKNYLTKIANVLAREKMAVEWTSPSGLPITNLYLRRPQPTTVKTYLGNKPKRNQLAIGWGDFWAKKCSNSIAPNLVHSLDAAHLVAVANACAREEITLTTIHDCFATTANLVPRLQRILLEQLYELYAGAGGEVLAQIRENAARALGSDTELPALPPLGTLFLPDILNSEYAFS